VFLETRIFLETNILATSILGGYGPNLFFSISYMVSSCSLRFVGIHEAILKHKVDYIKNGLISNCDNFYLLVTWTLAPENIYGVKVEYIGYQSFLYNDRIGVKLREPEPIVSLTRDIMSDTTFFISSSWPP
jgi:hypothetical protein